MVADSSKWCYFPESSLATVSKDSSTIASFLIYLEFEASCSEKLNGSVESVVTFEDFLSFKATRMSRPYSSANVCNIWVNDCKPVLVLADLVGVVKRWEAWNVEKEFI